MSSNENKSKSKAAALAIVVSMVIANPLIETGCEPSQPKIVVDEDQLQQQDKDKDDQNNNPTAIYGGGHGGSPFIFHSYSSIGKAGNTANDTTISSGGWKTWTAPASEGSYSGVHMTGFSS